jgi:hypothetical protein
VYFILLLIALLSLPPETRPVNPDLSFPVTEPHCQNAVVHFAEAEKSLFLAALMRQIPNDNASRVVESPLRVFKGDMVLFLIYQVLRFVPKLPLV